MPPSLQDARNLTDEQWVETCKLVSSDYGWQIQFPTKPGMSVRIIDPQGIRMLVKPNGEVERADDQ
jgi:hypothetical protein